MTWSWNGQTIHLLEQFPIVPGGRRVEIIPPRLGSTAHIVQQLYTLSPQVTTRGHSFFLDYTSAQNFCSSMLSNIGTRSTLQDLGNEVDYQNCLLIGFMPRIIKKPIHFVDTSYSHQVTFEITIVLDQPVVDTPIPP